jgi:hypothetical protein
MLSRFVVEEHRPKFMEKAREMAHAFIAIFQ